MTVSEFEHILAAAKEAAAKKEEAQEALDCAKKEYDVKVKEAIDAFTLTTKKPDWDDYARPFWAFVQEYKLG